MPEKTWYMEKLTYSDSSVQSLIIHNKILLHNLVLKLLVVHIKWGCSTGANLLVTRYFLRFGSDHEQTL